VESPAEWSSSSADLSQACLHLLSRVARSGAHEVCGSVSVTILDLLLKRGVKNLKGLEPVNSPICIQSLGVYFIFEIISYSTMFHSSIYPRPMAFIVNKSIGTMRWNKKLC
jgi:hypothetical protein